MNVLLLASDEDRGRTLCEALEARGVFVRLAKDAIYVLTMAERASIDMMFVSAEIDTMTAADFASIVTGDPGLAKVKLAIFDLADDAVRATFPQPLQFVDHVNDEELVQRIASSIKAQIELNQAPAPGGWKEFGPQEISMIGMFEMTTLPDLLQMVCASDDEGTILIRTPFGEARIGFTRDRVVAIEYRRQLGIDAMAFLMEDIELHPRSQFRVSKALHTTNRGEGVRPGELLLEVAVVLDDRRSDRTAGGAPD